ncbi:MAG: hypothetical protein JKY95_14650 [Planctomycetaceae bacterium]|nr:hypothetical protein [Planctomycetaceae bacterium]
MATFLAAMLVFAAAVAGLSIGVILSNRCLKGTCGGLNSMANGEEKSACGICSSAKVTPSSKSK